MGNGVKCTFKVNEVKIRLLSDKIYYRITIFVYNMNDKNLYQFKILFCVSMLSLKLEKVY